MKSIRATLPQFESTSCKFTNLERINHGNEQIQIYKKKIIMPLQGFKAPLGVPKNLLLKFCQNLQQSFENKKILK